MNSATATSKLEFPLRHISIRVPWHDAGWAGLVCLAPHLNGACAKLKGIAAAKNEQNEKLVAGRSLEELPRAQWPCCVEERAAFMAPFEMEHLKKHALAKVNPKQYGHFQPTDFFEGPVRDGINQRMQDSVPSFVIYSFGPLVLVQLHDHSSGRIEVVQN